MSTRDDFDDIVAGRLRAAAPQEAPPHLMDTIIDRVAATPQRGRGPFAWLGSPAFSLMAVAAVVLAAVVVGTQFGGLVGRPVGADPSPDASASGAPPSPKPSSSATDPASPSPSPTASDAPESGDPSELLLRLVTVCDVSPPQLLPRFTLMADGTVVWHSSADIPALVYTRRLTPDGLAEMREYLFGSGVFETSAEYVPELRPGAPEPPGHGACAHTYTAHDGDVVVRSTSWFGEEEETTYYQPAPERQALDLLAGELLEPEALVDESAWATPAAIYEGTEYQLMIVLYADSPGLGSGTLDASDAAWPFEGPVDAFGVQGGPWGAAGQNVRCGPISRDDANALIASLEDPEAQQPSVGPPWYWSLAWEEGNGSMDVHLVPLMPDGFPGCADAP